MSWLSNVISTPPPALSGMRLGPEGSTDNPLLLQFFTWNAKHDTMSWWKHLECEIPRLAKMGFTQIWLPPLNKAATKEGRGYDAYDLWDLGEFNQKGTISTRWGTKQELIEACDAGRRYGIDIISDAVLNHKVGADRSETFPAVPVHSQNRLKEIGGVREIEGWTAFDFPGRGEKYSTFHWTHEHFTGLDWDRKTRTKAIYRIAGKGRQGWSKHVDRELGNYDYLLGINIDHRHPDVRNDLLQWGPWVLKTTGAQGFRLDAIKHIDRKFMLEFIKTFRSEDPKRVAIAEYWSGNLKLILPYIKAFRGATAFFDVPLHMNFNQASRRGSRYDLRTILNDTIVSAKPNDAVTFVDNHDTVEGQSLESWVDSNFKIQAYTIILLREHGYPCVFYGDLYPNPECYNENIARNLELLIEARKLYAYGPSKDYFQQKNCIGFVRMGDATHEGCAVMVSNQDESGAFMHRIRMDVGRKNAGTTYRSFMQQHGRVEIDAEGWGTFSCFANNVQVWVKLEES